MQLCYTMLAYALQCMLTIATWVARTTCYCWAWLFTLTFCCHAVFMFPRISGEKNNLSNSTVPDPSSLWRGWLTRLEKMHKPLKRGYLTRQMCMCTVLHGKSRIFLDFGPQLSSEIVLRAQHSSNDLLHVCFEILATRHTDIYLHNNILVEYCRAATGHSIL